MAPNKPANKKPTRIEQNNPMKNLITFILLNLNFEKCTVQ